MLNIKDLSSPELPKKDNYEQALKIGLEIFGRKDPGRVAARSGVDMVGRSLVIPHLDREILFELDNQRFFIKQTGEEAPTWLGILVLHYLNNSDGRPPTGRLKHFREFKEGHFYEPAFNQKTKDVLISIFGNDPALMMTAGKRLNGKLVATGDASVELSYFPLLPITCIVWKGDEEFPPEASVLFDETADLFFSAEDMAVAGQMAVLELLKAARG